MFVTVISSPSMHSTSSCAVSVLRSSVWRPPLVAVPVTRPNAAIGPKSPVRLILLSPCRSIRSNRGAVRRLIRWFPRGLSPRALSTRRDRRSRPDARATAFVAVSSGLVRFATFPLLLRSRRRTSPGVQGRRRRNGRNRKPRNPHFQHTETTAHAINAIREVLLRSVRTRRECACARGLLKRPERACFPSSRRRRRARGQVRAVTRRARATPRQTKAPERGESLRGTWMGV